MSRLNRKQGELFDGPTVGDLKLNAHRANYLYHTAIPSVSGLATELQNAGALDPSTASQVRTLLRLMQSRLAGNDPY